MPLRSFRIVELGVGSAQKIVELSGKPRHAKDEFLGVDLQQANVPGTTNSVEFLGLPKPTMEKVWPQPNLKVTRGKDAVSFLAEQPSSSVDHIYAHFLAEHIPLHKRKSLFAHAMKVMRPGARLVMVEQANWNAQLRDEISKTGFVVHSKPLNPADLRRLGTNHARTRLASYEQHLQTRRTADPSTLDSEMKLVIRGSGESLREILEEVEGKKRGTEARAAIDRVVQGAHLSYENNPWVAIYARKPRVEALQSALSST